MRAARRLAARAFLLLLFVRAQETLRAQQPPAPPQQPEQAYRVAARVERVNVDVAVTDARGHFVPGLRREQFHLFDNGAEQPITDFSPVEAPARVLLLVETSPAVYLLSREHVMAAYRLLDGLAPEDLAALGTYDDRFHPSLDFSVNKALVAGALGHLQFSLGSARLDLFGSLAAAIEHVQSLSESAAGSKTAIVLLSTGLSDVQAESVRTRLAGKLQVSGVAVYAIALGGNLRSPGKKTQRAGEAAEAFAQADRDLREIAKSSGASAYFPRTDKELVQAYVELAETLRHLYSLAFVPPAHDGKAHVLRVEVRDAEGKLIAPGAAEKSWRLLARPAYLAPAE
jgi:Ca-activated chloride channel family protein